MRQDFVRIQNSTESRRGASSPCEDSSSGCQAPADRSEFQQRDADRVSFRISRSLGGYICNGPVAAGRKSRRLRAHRLYAAREAGPGKVNLLKAHTWP